MMKLGLIGAALLALVLVYVAMPFHAAWSLRQAVRTNDVQAIERKVDWTSVRGTLKASLARHAQLLPEISQDGELAKPKFWQRVRMAFGQPMIDSFVERYVTPEGLPKLYGYKQSFNAKAGRPTDRDEDTLSTAERLKRFWARLHRAEFTSPGRFELEMEDRHVPGRRFVSQFELRGWDWILVGVHVVAAGSGPLIPTSAPIEADTANAGLARAR